MAKSKRFALAAIRTNHPRSPRTMSCAPSSDSFGVSSRREPRSTAAAAHLVFGPQSRQTTVRGNGAAEEASPGTNGASL